jgi:NDP-sugar pyrophosphorylase family protein
MKMILICPSPSPTIAHLTEHTPPATLPFLGENFICYWMEYLAASGVKEVRILAADRVEQIQDVVGDGSRWGFIVEVVKELRDLDVKEARKLHKPTYETDWVAEPADVLKMDCLPGCPEHKAFESYASWFAAVREWAPRLAKGNRIGLKEIAPGVWAGRKVRISSRAKLIGPCFIGDNVRVEKNAVVGPFAFLEDQVVADEACEINNSWVGPDTFVGSLTKVENSLAWGSSLINWKNGSHLLVPDSFLMCSLSRRKQPKKPSAPRKLVVAVQSGLTRPWEAVMSMAQKMQG